MRDLLKASGMDVDSMSLGVKPTPEKAINIGLLAYDQDEVGVYNAVVGSLSGCLVYLVGLGR